MGKAATYYIDMHKVLNNLPDDLKEMVEEATLIHGGNNRYKGDYYCRYEI